MNYSSEFRRCLLEEDVNSIMKLWKHVSPHLPQPANEEEARHSIHLARSKMNTIPKNLQNYSLSWLKERETTKIVHAIGISVGFHNETNHKKRARALEIRESMSDAVITAIKEGVDLETEISEFKNRMMTARNAM